MLLPKACVQILLDRTLRRMCIPTKRFSVSVGAMMETMRNRPIPSYRGLSFMILLKERGLTTPQLPMASHCVARKLMPLSVPTLGWTDFWLSQVVQLQRRQFRATTRAVLWWACQPSHCMTSPTRLGLSRPLQEMSHQYDQSSVRLGAHRLITRLSRCMSLPEVILAAPHAKRPISFIFGGALNPAFDLAAPDDEGYKDVYLLSLPAFQWFKANATVDVRRASHTCSVIGKRQTISIGGRFPSSRRALGHQPDPWSSGIGIFDMTLLRWQDHYYAGTEKYDMPDVVKSHYTASYQEPSWSNDTLASNFSERRLMLSSALQADFDCRVHRRACVDGRTCIERARRPSRDVDERIQIQPSSRRNRRCNWASLCYAEHFCFSGGVLTRRTEQDDGFQMYQTNTRGSGRFRR